MDRKNTEANLQMGGTQKREATIKMERRSEKTECQRRHMRRRQRVAQLAVKAAREESVKRWRRE